MEEKDIKELWKQGDELDSGNYSQEVIDIIIRSKPKDIVSNFIKALRTELWFNLVALIGLSVFMFYRESWLLGAGLIVLNVLVYIYYDRLIKRLSQETIDTDVVQYLCTVYKFIQRFIQHYKLGIWVITIPMYFFGIYFSEPDTFTIEEHLTSIRFYVLIAIGLAIAIALLYIFLYFLYGKKANKIKKMVETLNQEEVD